MAEQDKAPEAGTAHHFSAVSPALLPPPSPLHMLSVSLVCVCLALFWSSVLVCLGCAGWAASVPGAELMACQVLPTGWLCLPLCSATVNAEPTDCCRGNTTSSLLLFLIHTNKEEASSNHISFFHLQYFLISFYPFFYHNLNFRFLSCSYRNRFLVKCNIKDLNIIRIYDFYLKFLWHSCLERFTPCNWNKN